MPSRTFTYEELVKYGANPSEARFAERVDEGRWSAYYEVVFVADGKHYLVSYEEGLTEHQDYSGPDHYPDMSYATETVECPEVELYQKQVWVTDWRNV